MPQDEWQQAPGGAARPRPYVRGKFLYLADEKYWVRGVAYGAFPPHPRGDWFPDEELIARDFGLMRSAGINTILTYTLPSARVLDLADEFGLKAILNIPWFGCDYYLERRATQQGLRRMVVDAIQPLRGHPAILMWCVGKELSPDIVRWYGKPVIESLIHDLYDAAKDADPDALVSFTNFPTTEYLELPFLDVCTYNVYLHTRPEFCGYLSRLQHVAGELPLVITEFGMCSFRHGEETQAGFLEWQMQEIFDHGCAGAVVFSWTDPFFGDGVMVEDWGFGLVDAQRAPKPSFAVVQQRFRDGVPFPPERHWPKVSVVVTAYNAARTLDACLSSLKKLDYPDYEVIIVDDGSNDGSASIMARYPFRTIVTANSGVSAARNQGLSAASGEVMAYIDSDARADADWLSFLVGALTESAFVAVGGPNLLPEEDGPVAQCVYRAPGGPTHVMLDDQTAEHIPGCNMAFWKSALEAIGGFDPVFTKAGDDVDICWRLMAEGGRIGFSPSAIVWHHRRSSVGAYWRQQVGYGVSEALLERRHPNKFNRWGHALWAGRIYSPYPVFRLFSHSAVYHGLWGSAPFQPMYEARAQHFLAVIPRAPEWYGLLAVLLVTSFYYPWALLPAACGAAYTGAYAIVCAGAAKLDSRVERNGLWARLHARAIIAWLHVVEPMARTWGRLKGGLTPWRQSAALEPSKGFSAWWPFPIQAERQWTYDLRVRLDKSVILRRMTSRLNVLHCATHWNMETDNWDIQVRRGVFALLTLRLLVEHRAGTEFRVRCKVTPKQSLFAYLSALVPAALAIAAWNAGAVLLAVALLPLSVLSWTNSTRALSRLDHTVRAITDEVVHELAQQAETQRPADGP